MTTDPWDVRRSVRRHLVLSIAASGLLVGVLGGWATTTELAGAVIAAGRLVVATSVKKVQHPTGGVVGEVLVHDGDTVHAGDVLLRLDETVTRANLAAVENNLIELYARLARLEAERDGSNRIAAPRELDDYSGNAKVGEVIAGETRLFNLRSTARAGQKLQLQERTGQLAQEIQGLTGQIAGKKRETDLINQELAGVRELWRKNLIPIQRLTALERDSARIEGELGQLVASVAQTKGKISETNLQIIQIDQDLRSDVAKELREVQGKIAELVEKRVAAQDQLKRIDVRSPQNGTISQLAVHTVGGVIGPGEQLMLVVPQSDDLVADAKVAPRDIDQVHLHQRALLRFTAFNQRTTPEIEGKVTLVGADEVIDDKQGTSFFKVQATPIESQRRQLDRMNLVPGMPVEILIQTSSRTFLSYLIKPMADQMNRAFRSA